MICSPEHLACWAIMSLVSSAEPIYLLVFDDVATIDHHDPQVAVQTSVATAAAGYATWLCAVKVDVMILSGPQMG